MLFKRVIIVIFFLFSTILLLGSFWPAFGGKASGARLARMEMSAHYQDGRFFNLLPTPIASSGNFYELAKEYMLGGQQREPDIAPSIPQIEADIFQRSDDELAAIWFGHSTVFFEIGGVRLLTDPIFSARCSPVQWAGPKRFFEAPVTVDQLPSIHYVLISHDHYDHLDEQTIRALASKTELFLVPLGVGAHLEVWGVAPHQIVELDWWQEYKINSEDLLAFTPSRHFSGRRLTDRNKTLWGSWVIQIENKRFYFSGDTGYFPGFAEIGERYGPFDTVFLEVGAFHPSWATVHLGTQNAVKAMELLNSDTLFPVHWGTFNLALHGWTEPIEELLALQKQRQFKLHYPAPGKRIALDDPAAGEYWWRTEQLSMQQHFDFTSTIR